MRIHVNSATLLDVMHAATIASQVSGGEVTVHLDSTHDSRSHRQALEIKLTGDGTLTRRQNMSKTGIAATYDQWGHFLAELYRVDPTVKAGPYRDAQSFHAITGNAFLTNA